MKKIIGEIKLKDLVNHCKKHQASKKTCYDCFLFDINLCTDYYDITNDLLPNLDREVEVEE